MRLEGKVAIITGGAHGMGAVEAKLFALEGAKVVIGDVREEDGRKVESEIAEAGGEAMFIPIDVSSEDAWRDAVERTVAHFSRLDVLVNNAGISGGMTSDLLDTQSWDRLMEINAKGVFLGVKYAIPEMRKAGGGSIINISSIYGIVGSGGSASYHASKGAVRIFTKSAAVQYAREGIRVNSVHPGFVDSPMTEAHHGIPQVRQARIGQTPLGRLGVPEDIAPGILYLASDQSAFVTGSELVIDGGMIAS